MESVNLKCLQPGSIGSMKLKNRFLFPSMCHFYCDSDGFVTPQLKAYVKARVEGGAAAIIMPGSPHGKPGPARPALSDDRYCEGWRELAQICHAGGAKLITQIHPAKAQAGRDPGLMLPDQMPDDIIEELLSSYAACAARARRSGVDGVEIHGAHAHEVAQFLSPLFNHRTDRYGGSVEKRCRFASELIRRIKEAAGADYPVIFRMSSDELTEGGRRLPESIEVARLLEAAGADAIHISIGMPASEAYISAPMDVPDGFNLDAISAIHRAVSVPVIAVNRINTPELAERVIADDLADFIAVGRGMLADPDFVRKTGSGEPVRLCLGCNQGCKKAITKKQIFCVQNPLTGHEAELSFPNAPDLAGFRLLIAGAGICGLEAAVDFARRGADVEIWEKDGTAGGLIRLADVPPFKAVMDRMTAYRLNEAARLGVRIVYHRRADERSISEYAPDLFISAVGSESAVPPIPGIDHPGVMTSDAFFRGVKEGKMFPSCPAAILGGGLVGLEAADTLAGHGVPCDVFEMTDAVGKGLNPNRMAFIRRRLTQTRLLTNTAVSRIDFPYIEAAGERFGPYDTVIIALGRKPVRLDVPGSVPSVTLGDARSIGSAMEAVASAAAFALRFEPK